MQFTFMAMLLRALGARPLPSAMRNHNQPAHSCTAAAGVEN
jgi:hypothetical protein